MQTLRLGDSLDVSFYRCYWRGIWTGITCAHYTSGTAVHMASISELLRNGGTTKAIIEALCNRLLTAAVHDILVAIAVHSSYNLFGTYQTVRTALGFQCWCAAFYRRLLEAILRSASSESRDFRFFLFFYEIAATSLANFQYESARMWWERNVGVSPILFHIPRSTNISSSLRAEYSRLFISMCSSLVRT